MTAKTIIQHAVDVASSVCGIPDIRRQCRFVAYVRARRIVSVYLTKNGLMQREIADALGRERSTIAALVDDHDVLIKSDTAYRTAWEAFTLQIVNKV